MMQPDDTLSVVTMDVLDVVIDGEDKGKDDHGDGDGEGNGGGDGEGRTCAWNGGCGFMKVSQAVAVVPFDEASHSHAHATASPASSAASSAAAAPPCGNVDAEADTAVIVDAAIGDAVSVCVESETRESSPAPRAQHPAGGAESEAAGKITVAVAVTAAA